MPAGAAIRLFAGEAKIHAQAALCAKQIALDWFRHRCGCVTGRPGRADQPLSARHIRRSVKKYADAAFGKGHGLHPHSLRHTAAMLASETGTMRQVMNLLRHSGMRVTSIYLDHLLEQGISEMVETLDAMFAGEPAQEVC